MKPEIKFALGMAGMSAQTISDIEKVLPAMARLLALWKQVEPIYEKAKPDLDLVEPVVSEIINFIKGE